MSKKNDFNEIIDKLFEPYTKHPILILSISLIFVVALIVLAYWFGIIDFPENQK